MERFGEQVIGQSQPLKAAVYARIKQGWITALLDFGECGSVLYASAEGGSICNRTRKRPAHK
jgi:hypothetical protein